MAIFYRFLVKRATAANFTAANTLLLSGEFGLETDTRRLKMGDGVTAWNTLAYVGAGKIDLAGLSDGDVLSWDATAGKWVATTSGGGGLATFPMDALEALAAGQFVNIQATGVRLAKAVPGYEAHGFVLAAVALGATAAVSPKGATNTALSGRTPGVVLYLSATPGAATTSYPTTAGTINQQLGTPHSAAAMQFFPSDIIELV